MKPEVAAAPTKFDNVREGLAPPVIGICTDFNGGRSKPLPYGSSHVVGLNSESCQGSLLMELSPQATEGVKLIKVKSNSNKKDPAAAGSFLPPHPPRSRDLIFLFTQCVKAWRGNDRRFPHIFITRRGTFPNLGRLTGSYLPSITVKKAKRSCF